MADLSILNSLLSLLFVDFFSGDFAAVAAAAFSAGFAAAVRGCHL